MKVSISYPPIESKKGTVLLSQNRQFQYFTEPTYIYPIVPSYAATRVTQAGHEVIWDDGIAEEKRYEKWLSDVTNGNSDLILIETKTPVVKKHWKIIDDIKKVSPETRVILVGDHVTALPNESFQKSKVDFILTGGDYDFLLLNLVNWLNGETKLESGIWYRENGIVKNTGKYKLNHDLNDLPFIDRDLTKWQLYAYKNGNFKRTPGTYTMVGRDCWHRMNGGCSFCSWTTLYDTWRVRKPELLVDEIGILIEDYGCKTVFDDTGTFPVGGWLKTFCNLMIDNGYNDEVDFSCNMRFGACSLKDYKLMKRTGFRMLLFGLESANQITLDRINKNLHVEQIIDSCKKAKEAGLDPHITIMVGFPWETKEDAMRTVGLSKELLKNGYVDTLQATMIIPYPGTELFEECKENDLLTTEDWNDYDMSKRVMKSTIDEDDIKAITQQLYKVYFEPKYVFRKVVNIRSFNDLAFIYRGFKKVFGHLKDFSAEK